MSRCGSVLLATLFVGGMVATGVLVFRYGQELRQFIGDTSIESDVEVKIDCLFCFCRVAHVRSHLNAF